jgi:hypothetical protein
LVFVLWTSLNVRNLELGLVKPRLMERLVNRTNIAPCKDYEVYLLCIRKGASVIHDASKTKELPSSDVLSSTKRDYDA